MKTYKEFRLGLEEKSLIATAVDKYREMRDHNKAKAKATSGDDLDDDMKLDKPTSLQNQNVAKKKPG